MRASETVRYLLASGHLLSKVKDTITGPAFDHETLARWKKHLAEQEKQHSFLKDWCAATT